MQLLGKGTIIAFWATRDRARLCAAPAAEFRVMPTASWLLSLYRPWRFQSVCGKNIQNYSGTVPIQQTLQVYLSPKATHDERYVLPAKSEAIAQGMRGALFPGDVRDVVKIAFRIRNFVINGRR